MSVAERLFQKKKKKAAEPYAHTAVQMLQEQKQTGSSGFLPGRQNCTEMHQLCLAVPSHPHISCSPAPRPIPLLSQELSAAEHRAKLCRDLLPFFSCSSACSLTSSSGRAADPTRAIGMLL